MTRYVSTNAPLRVFLGFDSRETLAYHVAAHSILSRASIPVSITPLSLSQLGNIYTRQRGPLESTEFSLTRFLVPYLCDYKGVSVFMDSDIVCQADIADLMLATPHLPERALYVCQHDYTPAMTTKFLGQPQTAYPRKNWSSVAVFNCDHCRALSPEYVNEASGVQLHRLLWTTDQQIGALPLTWNWLVGEYEHNDEAKVLHFTNGTPCMPGYEHCDHADNWWREFEALASPVQIRTALMAGG